MILGSKVYYTAGDHGSPAVKNGFRDGSVFIRDLSAGFIICFISSVFLLTFCKKGNIIQSCNNVLEIDYLVSFEINC